MQFGVRICEYRCLSIPTRRILARRRNFKLLLMQLQASIRFAAIWIFNISRLYGLLPLKFCSKSKRFKPSTLLLCYSVMILMISFFGTPFVFLEIVRNARHPTSVVSNILLYQQYILNYIMVTIMGINAIRYRHELMDILNQWMATLRFLWNNHGISEDYHLVRKFLIKMLLVDIVLLFFVVANYFSYSQAYPFGWIAFCGYICMVITSVLNSGYLAFTFTVAYFHLIINLEVDRIVQDLGKFDDLECSMSAARKKQICHSMADKLKKLAETHRIIVTFTKRFVNIVGLPLALSILWNCSIFIHSVRCPERLFQDQLKAY